MRKQIKVTGIARLNFGVIVLFLSLTLGTFGAWAHNKPSVIQVEAMDEADGENNIEGWMGSDEYWGVRLLNDDVIEQERHNPVVQWMVSGSLWQEGNTSSEMLVEPWMTSRSYWIKGVNSGNQNTDFRENLAACDTHRKHKAHNH